VAVWPVLPCGSFRTCRGGRSNGCRRLKLIGVHRDGALQDHLLVPTTSLVSTPQLSAQQAALVEPASIGVHAVACGRLVRGEAMLVLGGGPIGVSAALATRDRGARVLVLDPVKSRRHLSVSLGFQAAEPAGHGPGDAALAHGGDDGPDVVIDTTGRAELLQTGIELARHGGRVVVVGLTSELASTTPGHLPVKELDVLRVSCCTPEEFADAASLVRRNRAAADALVSHVLPLSKTADALHLLEEQPAEAIKVLTDLRATESTVFPAADAAET